MPPEIRCSRCGQVLRSANGVAAHYASAHRPPEHPQHPDHDDFQRWRRNTLGR